MATLDPHGWLSDEDRQLYGPFLAGSVDRDGEAKAFCPLCEDPQSSKSPSAGINFRSEVWHCFACGGKGRLAALTKRIKRGSDVIDIKTRRPHKATPSEQTVRNWHKTLLGSRALLSKFRSKRGLSVATIKRKQIGYDFGSNRYTIPVWDAEGNLFAVKGYRPNARRSNKMVFLPEGNVSLYNVDVLLEHDEVVLVEGELDSDLLNQKGIPSVAHTAGAMGWQDEWSAAFKGKTVYVCPDDDKDGIAGAQKVCEALKDVARELYMMQLDTGLKGGDVTDFLVEQGASLDDFRLKMKAAREQPLHEVVAPPPVDYGRSVTLVESQAPETDPMELRVQIAGKQTPPYVVPRRFTAKCTMDKGRACERCPMMRSGGEREVHVRADNTNLLKFIDANEKQTRTRMGEMVGARCDDRITFVHDVPWTVEELYVSQSVEDRDPSDGLTPLMRPVFAVGTYATDTNTSARLVGVNVPDPRNNRAMFQAWVNAPVQSNIDQFALSDEMREQLDVFRPKDGEDPLDKCLDVAHDLANNVTRIYGRDQLHMAMDLVWHSVLGFDLQGQRVVKGWLECLVIGDTRTGKSEIARELCRHYNAGVMRSCEGASLAGLVGGVQQVGNKHWMVTWGLLPLNDRRLVVLDELSGIIGPNKGIIEAMSSIRSEGIAQLTKIASHQTSARTRTVWISNPVDGKPLSEVNGMDAMRRLVANPEDIARFDFALAAASGDVPSSKINTTRRDEVPHVYTSDLCSALVMWTWSRRPDQVHWAANAERALVRAAQKVGEQYVSEPPLVQPANIRVKLARIAIAFAARTFSTNAAGDSIVVRRPHIDAAVEFLHMVYGSEAMGYLRHSQRRAAEARIARSRSPEVRRWLKDNPDVLEALHSIGDDKFRVQDFEGVEYGDPYTIINKLRNWRMVRRVDRGFWVKEPWLVALLYDMEDE